MALTYNAALHKRSIGGDFLLITTVTPAASDYPTGGYLLDPTFAGQLVDGIVKAVVPAGINSAAKTTAYLLQYNTNTGKLQVFWSAASGSAFAEVTNGTDLSAQVFTLAVVGK